MSRVLAGRTGRLGPARLWRFGAIAGLVMLVFWGQPPVFAQSAPGCGAGEKPSFKAEIGRLADRLSYTAIGEPVECARTDGGGDTTQRTTTGYFSQPKSSSTPAFHRGTDHWAILGDGTLLQWTGEATTVPNSAREGVPADIKASFPSGAKAQSAVYTNLTGRGDAEWAVLFTQPNGSGGKDTGLGIFARVPGGWFSLRGFLFEGIASAALDLVGVGGSPSLAVSASVGAHGSQYTLIRWDGSNFATVLDVSSNAPAAATVRDLDKDGTPEVLVGWSPYCESYAASPRLVSVFRWNGTTYVDATGNYPDVVASSAGDVLAAFGTAGGWSANGRACLHWALGYLAESVGELDTAAQQYGRALAVDPGYSLGSTTVTPITPASLSPVPPLAWLVATTPTTPSSPAAGSSATSRGPTATPSATKTAAPSLKVGGFAVVSGVTPTRLNVRSAPLLSTDIVTTLAEGTRVRLLEGPRTADGRTWWRLGADADAGSLGWAVQDYLAPAAVPSPSPSPSASANATTR